MDEVWGIVELVGREIIAGRIEEQVIAGVPMLRVEVPATEGEPAYIRYYAGQAVYAITITSSGTAFGAALRLRAPAVAPYIVPPERRREEEE